MSSLGADPQRARPATTARVVAVLAVVIGLIFAADRLGDPYYAIVRLIGYVVLFGYVVVRLRACFRVAGRPEWTSQLRHVAFWLGLTALGAFMHIGSLFRTRDRDLVRLGTDCCLLFALMYSLELIELILKKPAVTPSAEETS
jgi:peptidoglycan biosynthesis protein MviN/MurJ (putative lipid II flippase)